MLQNRISNGIRIIKTESKKEKQKQKILKFCLISRETWNDSCLVQHSMPSYQTEIAFRSDGQHQDACHHGKQKPT